MNILITGGTGFIGRKLAARLLAGPELLGKHGARTAVTKLTLLDVVAPEGAWVDDPRVEVLTGDITDQALLNRALGEETDGVFHLAAVVSSGAEEDFDLGMSVNIDATRTLLEICKSHGKVPKFVFSSSCAAFGGDMPDVIQDMTQPTPQTSYGIQKVVGEMLVNDFSRKGYIDGCALRFPTVVVRPGKPNKAASTFASSIIREPLKGEPAVCPVGPETPMWLASPRSIVENVIRAHNITQDQWGQWRTVALPGFETDVKSMVDALSTVAGPDVAARINWTPDPAIEKIVAGWPAAFATDKAESLGFVRDTDMVSVVQNFIDDEMGGSFTP